MFPRAWESEGLECKGEMGRKNGKKKNKLLILNLAKVWKNRHIHIFWARNVDLG